MPIDGPGQLRRIPFQTNLLGLHSLNPERYPALIESTADDRRLGRFDILFAFPQQQLRLDANGHLEGHAVPGQAGFLSTFDTWYRELKLPADPEKTLPFTGGWFMLLGYELANEIEPRLALPTDPHQPVAIALRIPVAIIRDREAHAAWIVTEIGYDACADKIVADIASLAEPPDPFGKMFIDDLREDDSAQFLNAVKQAQAHIAAGDIYQANLSRRWTGKLRSGMQPVDIYRALRRTNPSPFAGIVALPDITVISSSPERLLRTDGQTIETRPIAGTRPRDTNVENDDQRRVELHDHPKERAEHVMLIDLERNDLGRVCKPGTVHVDEFMAIETYAHVHHIVSNVRGELREDATPGTIIRAVFPGGSITGCPKVRCMEIIHKLENRPRGVYTGAMGYINRDGSADLNILIRTITVTGEEVAVATGSGIVADSIPAAELDETRAKARGLLQALSGEGTH